MLKLFKHFVIFNVEEVLWHNDELTLMFDGVKLVSIKQMHYFKIK